MCTVGRGSRHAYNKSNTTWIHGSIKNSDAKAFKEMVEEVAESQGQKSEESKEGAASLAADLTEKLSVGEKKEDASTPAKEKKDEPEAASSAKEKKEKKDEPEAASSAKEKEKKEKKTEYIIRKTYIL